MSKEIDTIIRALQFAKRNGGLGEHFNDPRSGSFETTPLPIDGNPQEPVLDAGGCVIDPRYRKDDCPARDIQDQRGGIFPQDPMPKSKGWVATNYATIPSGGYGGGGNQLCSITIPDGYVGKMWDFGFGIVNHSTNYASITIKLLLSDQAEPLLSQNAFFESTYGNRIRYYYEIPPGKTLSLFAFNFGGAPLVVGGIMTGWAEPFFA